MHVAVIGERSSASRNLPLDKAILPLLSSEVILLDVTTSQGEPASALRLNFMLYVR